MNWHVQGTKIKDQFADWKKASPVYRWTSLFSFVILLLLTFLPIVRLAPMLEPNESIPLHYNIYVGVDLFGPWEHLFFLPILGLIFFLINLFAQAFFVRKEPLLSLCFAWGTLILESIFLVSLIFILLLNI